MRSRRPTGGVSAAAGGNVGRFVIQTESQDGLLQVLRRLGQFMHIIRSHRAAATLLIRSGGFD